MPQATRPETLLVAALQHSTPRLKIGSPKISAMARRNGRRSAFVKFDVPDYMVRSLNGMVEQRGVMLAVFIPCDVLDELNWTVVRP